MKCERVRELVSDALDGVLAGSIADRFYSHLDVCPPCRTFHTELKESLLLLEELPTVEVGEDFDRAVWAQIRTEEEPRSLADVVRERLEMLRVRFSFGVGLLRWSPVGAAALVLLGVAMSSAPDGEQPLGGTAVNVAVNSVIDGPSSPMDPEEAPTVRASFEEKEFVSGMPRAVENYLRSGRDLRLTNTERYERSNYSYPLRRIPEPVPVATQRPVSFSLRRGGNDAAGTASASTAPGVLMPTGGGPGVAVLEF